MVKAKDQFGISGINKDDTRVALTKKEIQQEKNELKQILNMGMPLTEKQRNDIIDRITGVVPITDASKNKVYSDMNTPSLGAKDGSLLAMADTGVKRGIVTAASSRNKGKRNNKNGWRRFLLSSKLPEIRCPRCNHNDWRTNASINLWRSWIQEIWYSR